MATLTSSALAINGGARLRQHPWPTWPEWDEADAQAVADVVRSGDWFSGTGTRVTAFAQAFAAFHAARFGAPCTNGTQALEIALRAVGVNAGDEVIVPPYTFIATASACVNVNAVPVFADIDPDTFNLDPRAVEAVLTERTRAIIAVHIAGCPADMDSFQEMAQRRGLRLIEDAAQAHAAEWRGRRVGALGDAGTFSFQASKNLNAGEGGILLTDQPELYDRAWSLINVGRVRDGGWYQHELLSGNYRMTEWQGALLLSQMRHLEGQTRRRNENALYLARQLAEVPGVRPLQRDDRVTCHAYHLFIFRYDPAAFGGLQRDDFLQALRAEGVPCSPGYTPLYRANAFRPDPATHPYAAARDYAAEHCPVAEQASAEAVWLNQPLLLGSRSDMDDIAAAVRKIQEAV